MALCGMLPLITGFPIVRLRCSWRGVACFLLSFLGGLISGYAQTFLGCLVVMETYMNSIDHKLYVESQTATTTNFCSYTSKWQYAYYIPLPAGIMLGIVSGWGWQILSGRGRQCQYLKRATITLGCILVSVGAGMLTKVKNTTGNAFLCMLIGIGVGLIMEAIPITPIQVAPYRRRAIGSTFDHSKLLGGIMCYIAFSVVSGHHAGQWEIVLYCLIAPCVVLFVISLIPGGDISEAEVAEDRSLINPFNRFSKKMVCALIPSLFGVSPRFFHGPLIVESLGLWGENPYVAVLIGGIVAFFATVACTFILIPRIGRRWVILSSLVVIFCCEIGSLLIFKIWGTQKNELKGGSLDAMIVLFMIMCLMSPLVNGPHGWSSDQFPPEAERAGRATESIVSTFASFVYILATPLIICEANKLYFLISACTTFVDFIVAWYIVV